MRGDITEDLMTARRKAALWQAKRRPQFVEDTEADDYPSGAMAAVALVIGLGVAVIAVSGLILWVLL